MLSSVLVSVDGAVQQVVLIVTLQPLSRAPQLRTRRAVKPLGEVSSLRLSVYQTSCCFRHAYDLFISLQLHLTHLRVFFFVKAGMNVMPLEVSLLSNFNFVFSVLLTYSSLGHVRLL
jgi:hypothetical protein